MMQTQQVHNKSYSLKIHGMNTKTCTAMVFMGNGIIASISGYMIDTVNFLEEQGVDPHELLIAMEEMHRQIHNIAVFDENGVFVQSSYKGDV